MKGLVDRRLEHQIRQDAIAGIRSRVKPVGGVGIGPSPARGVGEALRGGQTDYRNDHCHYEAPKTRDGQS